MFGQWAQKCILDFNYYPLPTDHPEKTYKRFCKFRQAVSDAEKWEVANDGLADLEDNGLYEALQWAAEECYALNDAKQAEKYINKIITSFLVPGLFLKARLCLDVGCYRSAAELVAITLYFSKGNLTQDYTRFNQLVLANLRLDDNPDYFLEGCKEISEGISKALIEEEGKDFSLEEKESIKQAANEQCRRLELWFNPKVVLTPSVIIHIEESIDKITAESSGAP